MLAQFTVMQKFHLKAPGKARKNKIKNLKKERCQSLVCHVQEETKNQSISFVGSNSYSYTVSINCNTGSTSGAVEYREFYKF